MTQELADAPAADATSIALIHLNRVDMGKVGRIVIYERFRIAAPRQIA